MTNDTDEKQQQQQQQQPTTKKISKKEAKKLAKKAEKQGKKKEATAATTATTKPTDEQQSSATKPTFYLENADTSVITLKACLAATLSQITLRPAPPSVSSSSSSYSFVKGPILTCSSNDVIVFGGNGIIKTLCSLGDVVAVGGSSSLKVDDWLEFERTVLRVDFNKGVLKLEEVLVENGGETILGGSSGITAADISLISTLHHQLSSHPSTSLPPTVQKYLTHHTTSSPSFTSALSLSTSLLPSPPFDYINHSSLLAAVTAVFQSTYNILFAINETPSISRCANPKHGDFQCTDAMKFFGLMKKSGTLPTGVTSPQSLAQLIINAVTTQQNPPIIEELAMNGPGFIVCRVTPSYLEPHINRLLSTGTPPFPIHLPPRPPKCVVDFSSPNIAKEMHVGHLRSTIIGEAVCRILEYGGSEVERVNHVGDWGTQFGMLIQFLKEEYPGIGEGSGMEMEGVNITDLTKFYKSAKERFDSDPTFKKASQDNVVLLQSGNKSCLAIWNLLCDISRKEFEKVYQRLDITLKECGESFYNDKIPAVIEEIEQKGKIKIEEGGAKCLFVEGFKIPLMLQKSDGGYGYDSTDMAALKYRLTTLSATRLIYITDFSQGDHFKMCFTAARDLSWLPSPHTQLEHIGFGTVQGEDGKRFKTRSGDTVRLVDLLDEAVVRMTNSLEERLKENKVNITAEEIPNVAATLGYSAVKYFDLRRNPTSNYVFSYDRMLETNGNTAIYLLYAHARLESIITKGKKEHNVDIDELVSNPNKIISLTHPAERTLALQLHMFADMIETTLEDLYPYHVCDYLYGAANAVGEFVTKCRVLGSEEMESRLMLCRATSLCMRKCFDLLGIRYVMRI